MKIWDKNVTESYKGSAGVVMDTGEYFKAVHWQLSDECFYKSYSLILATSLPSSTKLSRTMYKEVEIAETETIQ